MSDEKGLRIYLRMWTTPVYPEYEALGPVIFGPFDKLDVNLNHHIDDGDGTRLAYINPITLGEHSIELSGKIKPISRGNAPDNLAFVDFDRIEFFLSTEAEVLGG